MNYRLVKVREEHLELLMNWRMREDISAMMFSDVKLTMEMQREWYKRLQKDTTQIRWIIMADEKPIGSMYLTDIDRANRRCESGWFVAEKEYRSLPLAMALQQNMFDYVFDVMKLNRVYGYVIDDNKSLIRLLQMCGLELEGTLREHVCKNEKLHDVFCVGLTENDWKNKKESKRYFFIEIE